MAVNNIDNMSLEEQALLEQMVTEALMRDKQKAPDADAAWGKMAERLDIKAHENAAEEKHDFSIRAMWAVVATVAAIALVVVLLNIKGLQNDNATVFEAKSSPSGIVVLDAQDKERAITGNEIKLAATPQVEKHTIVVPEGKDVKLTLMDGTEVWLNANSRFTYPTSFRGKERQVSLQGEAYFKVAHDSSHPFIVKAGNLQTRVLGTEFNIRAFDSAHPHVTLVKGCVKVSSSINNKVLVPGEDALVDEQGGIKVSEVDVNDVICWKDGIQLFNDTSLRDILTQLGSWYNVSVICHDNALLNSHFHYMYDRHQGLEEALKLLNSITNNKVKLHKNTILIE